MDRTPGIKPYGGKKPKKSPGKPFEKDDPRRWRNGKQVVKDKWITAWLVEFGQMPPDQVAARLEMMAKQYRKLKTNLPTFAVIAGKALLSLCNEPDSRLFTAILDRVEGKVKDELEMSGSVEIEGLDRMLSKVYGGNGKNGDESHSDG